MGLRGGLLGLPTQKLTILRAWLVWVGLEKARRDCGGSREAREEGSHKGEKLGNDVVFRGRKLPLV